MPKIFIKDNFEISDKIIIDDENFNHLKVLRTKINEEILMCNGDCIDYVAKISDIQKKFIEAEILEIKQNNNELPKEINLYQSLPKGDKFDYIIQKSVELGVTNIFPVITTNTVVKPQNFSAKKERYNKIALNAAEQCGRGIIPQVNDVLDINAISSISSKSDEIFIVAYEKEKDHSIKSCLSKISTAKKINIIIGAEGGFNQDEIDTLKIAGVHSISLGDRILRTETASLYLLSILNYEILL